MKPSASPGCLRTPAARVIEVAAAVITIIGFLTGRFSLRGFFPPPNPSLSPTAYQMISSTAIPQRQTGLYTPNLPAGSTSEDPEEFIRRYYRLVSQGDYQESFSLLSPDFKERNHGPSEGGYQGYVDWWDSVAFVEVISSDTEYSDTRSAKVVAVIHYRLNNGDDYQDTVYFQLTRSSAGDTWPIDATPTDWSH